jgi:hypothetical protein
VLVSDLAQRNAIQWIRVVPIGTVSNRNAIGAAVRVVTPHRTLTQWVAGKSGYLSQSVSPLYFGLGTDVLIERVEIDWPSGQRQVVPGPLHKNSTIRLEEPR